MLLSRSLNPLISLPFSNLFIGLKSVNVLRIKLSLTLKLINTNQPAYLYDFISLQPSHSTSSSPVVILAWPPTHSTLKITDCPFRYASPHLWNQLSDSFCQPQPHLSPPDSSLLFDRVSSTASSSPLSPSIIPSFFHSRLKTLFINSSLHPLTDFADYRTAHRFFYAQWFSFCFSFSSSVFTFVSRFSYLLVSGSHHSHYQIVSW